jgi:hypothetical protein
VPLWREELEGRCHGNAGQKQQIPAALGQASHARSE